MEREKVVMGACGRRSSRLEREVPGEVSCWRIGLQGGAYSPSGRASNVAVEKDSSMCVGFRAGPFFFFFRIFRLYSGFPGFVFYSFLIFLSL